MNSLTKNLIIGLATLSVTGTAIIAGGMYAASTGSTNTNTPRLESRDPTTMLASIKSQVSAEAYTALETLMNKHKAEMDALKSSSGTLDRTAMEARHTAFRAEMDALMTKYPELKTALPAPQMNKMGKWKGNNEIATLLASVSDTDKAAIEAIRTEYRTKQEALRTEEKSKIDTILAKYPEVKAKLDALESSRPQGGEMMGGRGGPRGQR